MYITGKSVQLGYNQRGFVQAAESEGFGYLRTIIPLTAFHLYDFLNERPIAAI